VRATLDPMQEIVFDNDTRIVELTASKLYADAEHPIGAYIQVRPLEAAQAALALG